MFLVTTFMQSQCLIDILIEFLNLAFLIDVFNRRFLGNERR
jgi:hypothetical protein